MSREVPLKIPSFDHAVRLDWSWELEGSPSVLWPMISDTNKLNVLAGLPPVSISEAKDARGEVRRVGHGRQMGRAVSWDEHPFEWEAPTRFGVTRTFHSGALAAYRCTWRLTPRDTGTTLHQTIELVPRHPLARPLVRLVAARAKAGWDQAYRAIDDFVQARAAFPLERGVARPRREGLEAIAQNLVAAGHAEAMVERLVSFVWSVDPVELQYMRPFVLADRWGVSRTELLSLFLMASAHGLVERQWSHMCPQCRGPKGTVSKLAALSASASCTSCDQAFSGTFDASIELTFRPARALRDIPLVSYCVGGPGATPHVIFQARLEPGARLTIALEALPGAYLVRTTPATSPCQLLYLGEDPVSLTPECVLGASTARSRELQAAGPQLSVTLLNDSESELGVAIEQTLWSEDAVTAALVATMPGFKEVCAGDAPGNGLAFPIAMLAFLVARADSSAAVEAINRHGGSVFNSEGGSSCAAFYDPLCAVEAGLALQDLGIAAGIAAGACEAIPGQNGLAYAGQPLDGARTFAATARVGELVLDGNLAEDGMVRLVIAGRPAIRTSKQPLAW